MNGTSPQRLVLIDRDGVINVEKQAGYVESPAELEIYPNALKAFALLAQQGFTCVVVTNQSVVGRGIISHAQLDAIHSYLAERIAEHGGKLAEVFACTDHPQHATNRRKPGAGMLLEAIKKHNARASDTPMIGDAITDMQAARAAGCQRYLVMTGKGKITEQELKEDLFPVTQCEDILDAAHKIIATANVQHP